MSRALRALVTMGRAISVAVLMATVLLGAATSPKPVAAEGVVVRDHRPKDAWLEVVINKIIIHNDQDGFATGSGELYFRVLIGSLDAGCAGSVRWESCFTQQLVKSDTISFSADSGQTVTQNRVVPRQGDLLSTSLIRDAGVTVHPGTTYGVEINGAESDLGADDQMGITHLILSEDSDWSIGTHLIRARGGSGASPAHYSVELEVRRVALADLTPESLKVVNRVTERPPERFTEICLTVGNIGPKPALGYHVNFQLDGAPINAAAGAAYPGDHDEVCARIPAPALGEHQLNAVIVGIPEMDLSNNEMRATYVRTVLDDIRAPIEGTGVLAPAESSSSGPTGAGQIGPATVQREQSASSFDLAVTSIQVRNASPNGRSDCDPGKNDVVVTVKNQGSAKASNLQLSLVVDDDDAKQKSIANLEGGKDTEVTFNDVQMDRGRRTLTAIVSPKDGDAADRAELKNTVNCQNE